LGGDESDSQGGFTALMFAASSGHADCVRLLIDAGADKEIRNNVRAGRCFAGRHLVLHIFLLSFSCTPVCLSFFSSSFICGSVFTLSLPMR
jgi:ankyrin repeat protein